MAQEFARGKNAFGFCDRCNFRAKLKALRGETVAGVPNNLRVCNKCWDADHPQNWQGRYPVDDPQALRDPRPDPSLAESRDIPPGPPFPPPGFFT